ncbi:MAG: helix-turn-helix domain-containing protein [Actinobacteria bacterium]|nr:helix-turn-helix domain-containing protein [Actinomycetota bacterium]
MPLESDARAVGQRPDARQGLLLTAAGRVVCRAVGTTAWAVLADIALDAEADAHGNLVAATNVRRIAANLGMSKDTAARALGRLVDAGLVVRHCRRGAGGHFVRSLYELRLDPDAGVTVVAPTPGPTSRCPVLSDTVAEDTPSADAGPKQCARPGELAPGAGRGPRRPRPGQEALFELGTDTMEPQ